MRHGIMNPRFGTLTVLAMVIASGLGCSAQTESSNSPTATEGSEISTHLATAPAFNSKTGAVTIAMVDETAEVYIQSADSSLMVNGVQVVDTSVTPNVTAIAAGSKSNVKTITVSDSTASHGDVVILNYGNGVFGLGSGTSAGTVITLKSAVTNSLVIKGTATADNFAFGATGISLTNGAKAPTKDITATNVSNYNVFLGAGDDIFTAGGNSAVGAAFTSAVSVFGGVGNDTLVEGALTTPHETFSGGDGTDTVDYSARPALHPVMVTIDPTGTTTASGQMTTAGTPTAGVSEGDYILDAEVIKGSLGNDYLAGGPAGTSVTLNGGAGNDTFVEGAAANGADTMVGGGGTDVVDYSLRTASLTVVMDNKTLSGDPAANSGAGEGDIIGLDVANIMLGSGGGTYTGNLLNNTFFASTAGSSIVNGGLGDDTLNEGLDAANGGSETFNGGAGIDTVDYSGRILGTMNVTMDGATPGGDSAGTEQDVIGTDVENLYGGAAADTLVGNANDNDIEGNGGGDTICGGAGNDTLLGNKAVGDALLADAAHLHGGDCTDDADPGYNICLNTGTHKTAGTPDYSPAAAGSQNCQLVSN